MTYDEIMAVYTGSNGDVTKALYEELGKFGAAGEVVKNLFRACKTSERAKKYRGGNSKGRYSAQAYDTKGWAINNLCEALVRDAEKLGITWGWSVDPAMEPTAPHRHVIYIDAPSGQVSFHNEFRGKGPDYAGRWDGVKGQAPTRICTWIEAILNEKPCPRAPIVTFKPDLAPAMRFRRNLRHRAARQQTDPEGTLF